MVDCGKGAQGDCFGDFEKVAKLEMINNFAGNPAKYNMLLALLIFRGSEEIYGLEVKSTVWKFGVPVNDSTRVPTL